MAEKSLPFVITDRRKFTTEGEPREGSEAVSAPSAPEPTLNLESTTKVAQPEAASYASREVHGPEGGSAELHAGGGEEISKTAEDLSDDAAAMPTQEQMEQSQRAFQATADRLDTAIRAANPGADHPPALTFESLIQSVYMQAVLQLGGGTQEGSQPQVDLLGARQSIDMLGLLAEKTRANLSKQEELLLLSAVFELRLAFLEMTQVLARSAAQRAPGGPVLPSPPGSRPGPSIVR